MNIGMRVKWNDLNEYGTIVAISETGFSVQFDNNAPNSPTPLTNRWFCEDGSQNNCLVPVRESVTYSIVSTAGLRYLDCKNVWDAFRIVRAFNSCFVVQREENNSKTWYDRLGYSLNQWSN